MNLITMNDAEAMALYDMPKVEAMIDSIGGIKGSEFEPKPVDDFKYGDLVVFKDKVFTGSYVPYYDEYAGHLFVFADSRYNHIGLVCLTDPNLIVKGYIHSDEIEHATLDYKELIGMVTDTIKLGKKEHKNNRLDKIWALGLGNVIKDAEKLKKEICQKHIITNSVKRHHAVNLCWFLFEIANHVQRADAKVQFPRYNFCRFLNNTKIEELYFLYDSFETKLI